MHKSAYGLASSDGAKSRNIFRDLRSILRYRLSHTCELASYNFWAPLGML
jgi:hypothetical protein